ncbi:MAG: HlyD family secretion protein [Acidobacteriota bacterium]
MTPTPEEAASTPSIPLYRRPGFRIFLVVSLAVLAVAGFFFWRRLAVRESTDDAFVDGPVVAVAARVAGTATSVTVEENDAVRAGQVLVKLDPHDYELAVQKAEADYQAAEAAVEAARAQLPITSTTSSSGLRAAEAQVGQARAAAAGTSRGVEAARARLAQAEANAERAASDVARLRPLVEKDEIPRQDFEHAQAAEKAAQAAVAEARQQVELAISHQGEAAAAIGQAEAGRAQAEAGPHRVEATQADIRLAEAKAAQARASLDLARSQLDDAVVRAPMDGIVGRKNVDPGESVQRGQPLVAIVPPDEVWITANFKETQIAGMRPGQKAVVHVDALDRDLNGHVQGIGAATGAKYSLLPAENASGNFVKVVQRVPVRIVLEKDQDPRHLLRPGMSVVPTVIVR